MKIFDIFVYILKISFTKFKNNMDQYNKGSDSELEQIVNEM